MKYVLVLGVLMMMAEVVLMTRTSATQKPVVWQYRGGGWNIRVTVGNKRNKRRALLISQKEDDALMNTRDANSSHQREGV